MLPGPPSQALKPLLFSATLSSFLSSLPLAPFTWKWPLALYQQATAGTGHATSPTSLHFIVNPCFPFSSILRCSHLHLPNLPGMSSGRKIQPVAYQVYHHAFQHYPLQPRSLSLWLAFSLALSLWLAFALALSGWLSLSRSLACFLSLFFSFFLSFFLSFSFSFSFSALLSFSLSPSLALTFFISLSSQQVASSEPDSPTYPHGPKFPSLHFLCTALWRLLGLSIAF